MNLDIFVANRDPSSDNEFSTEKYIDNELDEITILGFIQTLQNYLEVFLRNDVYSLTKYDKIQIRDTTIFKHPIKVVHLLQNWCIKCTEKKINVKYKIL